MNNYRYSRQIILPEIGLQGQKKISSKKVAIVGVGALGTVATELLARAGVGSLLLIDRDIIEESNLQRQTLFAEADIGKSKAVAAKERIQTINSKIKVTAEAIHLNPQNITILKKMDLILDCTDNLRTRFLINDYCKQQHIPWIYAAAIKTSGMTMPILHDGPCLRCFLKETNAETCDTAGVLNTITTAIASLQATMALKILCKFPLPPKLMVLDVWDSSLRTVDVRKNKKCPTCQGSYEYLQAKPEIKAIQFCSLERYQIMGKCVPLQEIKLRWAKLGKIQYDGASISWNKITIFKDGRALIKAKSEQEALALYSRYLGN